MEIEDLDVLALTKTQVRAASSTPRERTTQITADLQRCRHGEKSTTTRQHMEIEELEPEKLQMVELET